ncbi:hypothetical protein FE257_005164 [Aspergillus nanangensis]|uniref:Uncharacterized protein n=1 Tax=Aspergillus nanangensis TaxID=2582783 RepID=A0AAD4GMW6_ASPNN|nr:hypothetical protein FE257_005164 [Aspergillus nanangensis]
MKFHEDLIDGQFYQLTSAARRGDAAVVKMLLDRSQSKGIEARDPDDRTILGVAAKWGHAISVAVLLDFGADIEATDRWDCTALWVAARYGHTQTAALLLDRGANIETKTARHPLPSSPLLAAMRGRHYDTALLLVQRGADPNTFDLYHQTPLYLAVRNQNQALIKALLDRGADLHLRTRSQSYPLFCAVIQNNITMVHILLEAKGSPNLIGSSGYYKGQMPIVIAMHKGYTAIATLLLEYGAYPGRAWKPRDHYSWRWNPLQGWSARSPLLMTVILHIPRKGPWMEQMATMLIENGADSNSIDDDGNTPFFCAMITRNVAMMQLLCKFGADVYGIRNGRTVLEWARIIADPAIDAFLGEKGIHEKCTNDPDDINHDVWKPSP